MAELLHRRSRCCRGFVIGWAPLALGMRCTSVRRSSGCRRRSSSTSPADGRLRGNQRSRKASSGHSRKTSEETLADVREMNRQVADSLETVTEAIRRVRDHPRKGQLRNEPERRASRIQQQVQRPTTGADGQAHRGGTGSLQPDSGRALDEPRRSENQVRHRLWVRVSASESSLSARSP